MNERVHGSPCHNAKQVDRTRPPRLLLGLLLAALGALGGLLGAAMVGGCQESGVGRPCCTTGPGAGTDCVDNPPPPDPHVGTGIGGNDLKCATRACVYVQPQACQGMATQDCLNALASRRAECTESCVADGDCPEGFLCARPLVIGEYRCQAVCVRKEFLPVDPTTGLPVTTPAECADGGTPIAPPA
jgi:hypothetical protein